MFPHNEYTEYKYHSELLRQLEGVRLVRQFEGQSLRDRFGYTLLRWGVRLVVKDEYQTVETRDRQNMMMCQA